MPKLETKLFELEQHRHNLTELAAILGLSVSQVYRIRQGNRRINERFIIGALVAFPQYSFQELFYINKG